MRLLEKKWRHDDFCFLSDRLKRTSVSVFIVELGQFLDKLFPSDATREWKDILSPERSLFICFMNSRTELFAFSLSPYESG